MELLGQTELIKYKGFGVQSYVYMTKKMRVDLIVWECREKEGKSNSYNTSMEGGRKVSQRKSN